MTAHPLINRTSPYGQPFIGTCASCGKTGITMGQMREECQNPRNMTQEQALVEAIKGSDK